MRKNLYEAFTLVEMLIVMGILIILMAVGITAGRFAINRANDVAHQNAADQIYTALQAYYTDNRKFPVPASTDTLADMVKTGVLSEYLDNGAFNGGTETTYYYSVGATGSDGQVVLVCVAKGGKNDEKKLGIYCNGNGFGSTAFGTTTITSKDLEFDSAAYLVVKGTNFISSEWDGKVWK